MAIAPINRSLLPRLQHIHRQRRYARTLLERWQGTLPGRLMPALVQAPLQARPADSTISSTAHPLAEALQLTTRLHLTGPAGSGRTLAIQQLVLGWANDQVRLPAQMPLVINLAAVEGPPDAVLQAAVAGAGFNADRISVERGLAAGRWVLILDEWESLPASDRQIWHMWLLDRLHRYPALPALVVCNDPALQWLEFAPWQMEPVSPDALKHILNALLPYEEMSLMLPPLLSDEHLNVLSTRMVDVAALAMTYALNGFPPSRVRLYTTALDMLLRPLVGPDMARTRVALAGLGYRALLDKNPPAVPPGLRPVLEQLAGLISLDGAGRVRFLYPMLRNLCAAMAMAANQAIPDIDLADPDVQETLTLTAGLMTDPAPLYAAVCRSNLPDHMQTLVLGRCLREHRAPMAGWAAPILTGLARLAGLADPDAEAAGLLLQSMPDVLSATLANQCMRDAEGERWALVLLRLLPANLAAPHLIDLLGDSRLSRTTRRVAALQLMHCPEALIIEPLIAQAERALDDLGRVLTTLVLSASGSAGRQYLARRIAHNQSILPFNPQQIDQRSLVAAVSHLLSDSSLDSAVHTVAALALRDCATEEAAPLLLHACTAESATLRNAARRALLAGNVALALRSLGRLVLGDDVPWPARQEALQDLCSLKGPAASALLARLLASQMPLAGQIEIARSLARRGGEAAERLLMGLRNSRLTPSTRAVLAAAIANTTVPDVADVLLTISCESAPAPLRANVIRSLGHSGADEGLAVLAGIVEHERFDLDALAAAIETLAALGDESAVFALGSVLIGPLTQQLRASWQAALPTAADPPAQWPLATLPAPLQWRWGMVMADGITTADVPGNLAEVVSRESQRLRTLAAVALSTIGGTAARQMLREALLAVQPSHDYAVAPTLANQLIKLHAVPELMSAIQTSSAPLVRWASADALHSQSSATALDCAPLKVDDLDPETRSAMLTAIGSDAALVPLLERMVLDEWTPLNLRIDAVATLAQGQSVYAEGLLLALLTTVRDKPALQVAALDAMKPPLFPTTLGMIRQIVRDPNPPSTVAAAALRCLVRAGDYDALPIFLRYIQHDDPALVLASIDGLQLLNAPGAAPLLQRLAHATGSSHQVRLHAMRGLIQLEGPTHLPMLRRALEAGPVAHRLLALDVLLSVVHHPAELWSEYMDARWPLPLIMRLAQSLVADASLESLAILGEFLADEQSALGLRCLALEAVCHARYSPVLPMIEHLATAPETPLVLRRRAIEGLHSWRSEPSTLLILSTLAEDEMPYIRSWALKALW